MIKTNNIYDNILRNYLTEMEVSFTDNSVLKILTLLDEIYNFNITTNIVGSKQKEDIFYRHILDCISIFNLKFNLKPELKQEFLTGKKILDLGTGAGLPGLLFSILLDNTQIVLLEKQQKKANFLKSMITGLDLKNTVVLNASAEYIAKDKNYRESFDICVGRAVSKINILLELIIPFCKINGKIFLYKSKKVFLEAEENMGKLEKLGTAINRIAEVKVPFLDEFRAILILDKKTKTPDKYPRDFSIIKKEK
ncbi:MAG: 16S rRNA (guanine(527)-N(7))-methyltransferase RsmG [Candidatus Humimicrobiaceae bacterium]